MDLDLFVRVICNMLQIPVTRVEQTPDACADFEGKYCYDPTLQPALQADTLRHLITSMEDGVLYDTRCVLGVCIVFFRFQGESFIVGPFVRREYDEANIQRVLMSRGISASEATSIHLYYSAFPMFSITQVRHVIMSVIQAFTDSTMEYSVCRLEQPFPDYVVPQDRRAEAIDYSSIYRQYELENAFLHQVETGNTENVLIAFHRMNLDSWKNQRYVSAVRQNPIVSLSMVRVLARKAAERGGASPIEINEITQRAFQKILASNDRKQQIYYTTDMLMELTTAVKKARLSLEQYSPEIRRAVEYLRFHYSQEISSAYLAGLVTLSETYFTKRFKLETGMTVAQYIARLRCEEAAHLLRTSDAPIREICEFVGYPDNNYFVKVFKAQYGVTPSAYRTSSKLRSQKCCTQ